MSTPRDESGSDLDIRFDPLDSDQLRLLLRLSPGERIRVMLDAQALAKGLILGRLHRQYPDLSPIELGFKFVEEIERAKQTRPGP
ncbi:MAG TPA: hypothetical protein PKM78_14870 [Anaerolineae bacterium]|nr:hypothetical protein [Anaerolineae bacterium]HNU05347.1 hypothetical protein [Anaerolineae bacterium]